MNTILTNDISLNTRRSDGNKCKKVDVYICNMFYLYVAKIYILICINFSDTMDYF
jgi:hypothetical protein